MSPKNILMTNNKKSVYVPESYISESILNIYVCVLLIVQCTTPFVLKPSISARKNKRKTLLTAKKWQKSH